MRWTLAVAVLLLAWWAWPRAVVEPRGASIVGALSESPGGFERALAPRAFAFPADDGPHPTFQTEWWYWTGNLEARDGRRFGYQLTFFRRALPGASAGRPSGLAARDVWVAHFTVTDVAGASFRAFERWSRGAPGLAGARAKPFRVWLESWSVDSDHLRAAQGGTSVDLRLRSRKPEALHGERGLSRKSGEAGNASYYYSRTRLASEGRVNGVPVSGTSWLDREWSTSALAADVAGWDWMSLQLSDGRDLMLYRLRRKDGTVDAWSSGSIIAADGTVTPLAAADFRLEPTGEWRSAASGATYPSGWRVRVPGHGIDLRVTPRVKDQELRLSFTYWEGAVSAEGGGLTGEGYVELTGYAGAI